MNPEKIEEVIKEGEADVMSPEGDTLPPVEKNVELNSDPVPTPEDVEEGCVCEAEDVPVMTTDSSMTDEQAAVEKMLSQSEVNELIGRTRTETRDKTLNGVYSRYGVADESGLDDMVGRSQKYDMLHEDYLKLNKELNDVKVRLAMYDSGIDPQRYEDARLIITGKGLEVTPENIEKELATHPEWKKEYASAPVEDDVPEIFNKPSKITRMGNEPSVESGPSERDMAMSLFR